MRLPEFPVFFLTFFHPPPYQDAQSSTGKFDLSESKSNRFPPYLPALLDPPPPSRRAWWGPELH